MKWNLPHRHQQTKQCHCGLQWHTGTSNWSRYKRQVFFFFFAGLLWIAILIIRSKIWKVFHFANVFPAFSRFSRHGKSCFGRKKTLLYEATVFFPKINHKPNRRMQNLKFTIKSFQFVTVKCLWLQVLELNFSQTTHLLFSANSYSPTIMPFLSFSVNQQRKNRKQWKNSVHVTRIWN